MRIVKRPKKELKAAIIKTFVCYFLAIACLSVTFKKIRALLPPPEIMSNKIIGFAQYFGYPLYFDTIFVLFLIFLPVLLFYLFTLKKLNNE